MAISRSNVSACMKSFDSGDSNRHLRMIQVARGAEFPMVIIRTRLLESASTGTSVKVDLEVQFAGQTAHFAQVSVRDNHGRKRQATLRTIPATLSDFKIDPHRF